MMEWFPSKWAPSDFAVSLWLLTKEQLILRHLDELDRYPVKNHRLDSGFVHVHLVNMRRVSKRLLHKLAFRIEAKSTPSEVFTYRPRVPTPEIISERVSLVNITNDSQVSIVHTFVEGLASLERKDTAVTLTIDDHTIESDLSMEKSLQYGKEHSILLETDMLVHSSTDQGSDIPPNSHCDPPILKSQIEDIIHFSMYAKLAYKTLSNPALNNFKLLHSSSENDIFYSPFFVLIDHDWKSIVVTVRGSQSLEDALVDFKVSDVDLDVNLGDGYRVHSGYLTTARNLLQPILVLLNQVQQTSEYRDFKVVCTGHSLGGAISSIICYFLRKNGFQNAVCFGYAMPVVGSDKVAELFEEFCVSVVCGHDIVSRLSYQSWYLLTKDVERILKEADVPKYKVVLSMALNAVLPQQYSTSRWFSPGNSPTVIEEGPEIMSITIPERLINTPSCVPGKILYLEKIRDFANQFKDTQEKSRIEMIKDGLKHVIRRWILNQGSKRAIRFVYVPRWANKDEFKELVFSRTTLSDHTDCCEFVYDVRALDESLQLHTVRYR